MLANGRIWVTTKLPINLKNKRGSWDTFINAKNYPENIQRDEIFLSGDKICLEIEDSLVNIEAYYIFEAWYLSSSDSKGGED